MTDTQDITEKKSLDNFETIIFYAGMMKHLNENANELASFEIAGDYMTAEMKEVLFFFISHCVSMKRQKIFGIVPVLQQYKRLNPLFYHLSQSEALYYTVGDTLLSMRSHPQKHSAEFEDLLSRQREELGRRASIVSKSKERNPAFEALSREYLVRETEGRKYVFSKGSLNQINHRVLINLTRRERERLMESPAKDSILTAMKVFNEHYPTAITRDRLISATTLIEDPIAPLYNFDMSMEGTLNRAMNYTVDFSKEYAKLNSLEKQLQKNPNNKNMQKEYRELRDRIGTPNPWKRLIKKFGDDADLLRKLSLKKDAEEEFEDAQEKIATHMKTFSTILKDSMSVILQIEAKGRHENAIFSDQAEVE